MWEGKCEFRILPVCPKQENTKQETLTTLPWASWIATHNAGPQAWIMALKIPQWRCNPQCDPHIYSHSFMEAVRPPKSFHTVRMLVNDAWVSLHRELQIYLWYYSVVKRVYKALCLDMNSWQCCSWEEMIGTRSYNSLSVSFCTVMYWNIQY